MSFIYIESENNSRGPSSISENREKPIDNDNFLLVCIEGDVQNLKPRNNFYFFSNTLDSYCILSIFFLGDSYKL